MTELTLHYYIRTLIRILREPRQFFSEIPDGPALKFSLFFLTVSCLISTAGGLSICSPDKPVIAGGIYFINAMGMVFIAAFFSFIISTMFIKKQVSMSRFITIYAFSSGTTLIAAWVPFLMLLTEPWKWWLAGTGMIRGFGFTTKNTIWVIGASILCTIIFFMSALSALGFIKKIMADPAIIHTLL